MLLMLLGRELGARCSDGFFGGFSGEGKEWKWGFGDLLMLLAA